MVSCCLAEDMPHFEESERLELVKQHAVDRSRSASDCLVEVKDPVLPSCIGRHKVSGDVLTVLYEF